MHLLGFYYFLQNRPVFVKIMAFLGLKLEK